MTVGHCPRCGWTGNPRDIVEIPMGYGYPTIRCCPQCACEKIMLVEQEDSSGQRQSFGEWLKGLFA